MQGTQGAMLLDFVPDLLHISEVMGLLVEAAAHWVACSCCTTSTCQQLHVIGVLCLQRLGHRLTSHPLPCKAASCGGC